MSYVDIEIIPGPVQRATLGVGTGYTMLPVTGIFGNNPFFISKGAGFPPEYDALSTELQTVIATILAQNNAARLWVYQIDDAGQAGSDTQITKEVLLPRPDGVKTEFVVSSGPVKSIDDLYINLNKEPGDPDYGDQLLSIGLDEGGSDPDNYDVEYSPAGSTNPTGKVLTTGKTWTAPSGKVYDASVYGPDHFPPSGSTIKTTYTIEEQGFLTALRDASTRQGVRFICPHYPDMDDLATFHYSPGTDGSLLKDIVLLKNAVVRANSSYRFMHGIGVVPPHISASDALDAWGHSTLLPAGSDVNDWRNLIGFDGMILAGSNSPSDYGIVLMGMLMGLAPQYNPQLQSVNSFNCERYDTGKLSGMENAQICIIDQERFLNDTIVCKWGYTTSSDGQRRWIDDSRVKMELQFSLKTELTALLADKSMGQDPNSMSRIRARGQSVFDTATGIGMIQGYPPDFCIIPYEDAILTPVAEQTQSQKDIIEATKLTRIITGVVYKYIYAGGIRKIFASLGAI